MSGAGSLVSEPFRLFGHSSLSTNASNMHQLSDNVGRTRMTTSLAEGHSNINGMTAVQQNSEQVLEQLLHAMKGPGFMGSTSFLHHGDGDHNPGEDGRLSSQQLWAAALTPPEFGVDQGQKVAALTSLSMQDLAEQESVIGQVRWLKSITSAPEAVAWPPQPDSYANLFARGGQQYQAGTASFGGECSSGGGEIDSQHDHIFCLPGLVEMGIAGSLPHVSAASVASHSLQTSHAVSNQPFVPHVHCQQQPSSPFISADPGRRQVDQFQSGLDQLRRLQTVQQPFLYSSQDPLLLDSMRKAGDVDLMESIGLTAKAANPDWQHLSVDNASTAGSLLQAKWDQRTGRLPSDSSNGQGDRAAGEKGADSSLNGSIGTAKAEPLAQSHKGLNSTANIARWQQVEVPLAHVEEQDGRHTAVRRVTACLLPGSPRVSKGKLHSSGDSSWGLAGGKEPLSGPEGAEENDDSACTNHELDEMRRLKRQKSNRDSARRTRVRRQQRLHELEMQTMMLLSDNALLQKKLEEADKRAEMADARVKELQNSVTAHDKVNGLEKQQQEEPTSASGTDKRIKEEVQVSNAP